MNFSDSIIAIFSMGWLLGMITLAIIWMLVITNDDNDRDDKRDED